MVRRDLLDQIVWDEVIRLLEDPSLIQQELDRRLEAARSSNPTKKREQNLQRELAHVCKGIERLLSAYQEALMPIEQLRERMATLSQREQTLRAELQAITDQANDRAAWGLLAFCRNRARMPLEASRGIHAPCPHRDEKHAGRPCGVLRHGILLPNRRLYRDSLRLNP